MKKYIIAYISVTIAIALFLSLAVPAFATDNMTYRDYQNSVAYLYGKLFNGDITWSEFTERKNVVDSEYYLSIGGTVGDTAVDISDYIGTNMAELGQAVSDFFSSIPEENVDFYSGLLDNFFDDYTVLNTVENFDMNGATSVLYYETLVSGSSYYYIYYGTDGNFSVNSDGSLDVQIDYDFRKFGTSNVEANEPQYAPYSPCYLNTTVGRNGFSYYLYGSWINNTTGEADTELSIPATSTDTDFNFDNATDSDMEELFNKLLAALKNLSPDLSSIEGILNAIYYQVTGINSNMLTYDKCNALISALVASNNENAASIIAALNDIREELKNGGTGSDDDTSVTETKVISGTLYNVKPLDKNWLQTLVTDPTELKVEYQGKKYYLEPDGTLKLDDKYYYVDMNYDSYTSIDFDFTNVDVDLTTPLEVDFDTFDELWDSLSEGQQDKLTNISDFVLNFIGKSIPYGLVVSVLNVVQNIVFNVVDDPQDIVIDFDNTIIFGHEISGFSVTLLSADFFEQDNVKTACDIIKAFTTVVLVYAWALSMRKKVVAML